MEMSSGNGALTPTSGWMLCVICSFTQSSFVMLSKTTVPCAIVISSLHSSEAPLSYQEVSLSGVSTVPVLLIHLRDSHATWLSVCGAMYVFISFSIDSRSIGCLSFVKATNSLILGVVCPSWRSCSVISNTPRGQPSHSSERLRLRLPGGHLRG